MEQVTEKTLADINVNWAMAPACVESITMRDGCGCERTVTRPRLRVTQFVMTRFVMVPGIDVMTHPADGLGTAIVSM